MAGIKVKVNDADIKKIEAKLKRTAVAADKAGNDLLMEAAIEAQATARALAPVDDGLLRASIDIKDDGDEVTVFTDTEYAPYVEFGRKPGTWPNIGAIKEWARKNLGDESLGFIVARAIKEKGIAPRLFMTAGAEDAERVLKGKAKQTFAELIARGVK